MDPTAYPGPDLAVEIDDSPPQIDRPRSTRPCARRDLADRQGPKARHRATQPDGSYAPVEASRFLDLTVDEIHEWLTAEDISRKRTDTSLE